MDSSQFIASMATTADFAQSRVTSSSSTASSMMPVAAAGVAGAVIGAALGVAYARRPAVGYTPQTYTQPVGLGALLRHVVMFRFKPGASAQSVARCVLPRRPPSLPRILVRGRRRPWCTSYTEALC